MSDFKPPTESRHSPRAKAFPLEMLARKADNFLNSTFSNLPVTQEMEELGLLEISHADAVARGIADGDLVRVFNQRGRNPVAGSSGRHGATRSGIRPAVLGQAHSLARKNINVLTSEKLTDLGNSATFYSVLVEVELF